MKTPLAPPKLPHNVDDSHSKKDLHPSFHESICALYPLRGDSHYSASPMNIIDLPQNPPSPLSKERDKEEEDKELDIHKEVGFIPKKQPNFPDRVESPLPAYDQSLSLVHHNSPGKFLQDPLKERNLDDVPEEALPYSKQPQIVVTETKVIGLPPEEESDSDQSPKETEPEVNEEQDHTNEEQVKTKASPSRSSPSEKKPGSDIQKINRLPLFILLIAAAMIAMVVVTAGVKRQEQGDQEAGVSGTQNIDRASSNDLFENEVLSTIPENVIAIPVNQRESAPISTTPEPEPEPIPDSVLEAERAHQLELERLRLEAEKLKQENLLKQQEAARLQREQDRQRQEEQRRIQQEEARKRQEQQRLQQEEARRKQEEQAKEKQAISSNPRIGSPRVNPQQSPSQLPSSGPSIAQIPNASTQSTRLSSASESNNVLPNGMPTRLAMAPSLTIPQAGTRGISSITGDNPNVALASSGGSGFYPSTGSNTQITERAASNLMRSAQTPSNSTLSTSIMVGGANIAASLPLSRVQAQSSTSPSGFAPSSGLQQIARGSTNTNALPYGLGAPNASTSINTQIGDPAEQMGPYGNIPFDPSGYVEAKRQAQISPYELKAGSFIPAVLITGINSELKGQISGQVSQNVYDTTSGQHLLIPQGSRLVGSFNADIVQGQKRLLVIWQRIIFPDGSSISIGEMAGIDREGSTGFRDQVSSHFWKNILSASLISALSMGLQVGSASIIDSSTSLQFDLSQNLGGPISELLKDQFSVPPSLNVRPGYLFNIIVAKDIAFEGPYHHWN